MTMNQEYFLLLSKLKENAQSISKSIAIKVIESDDELYLKALDLILLLTKLEDKMKSNKLDDTIFCNPIDTEEINRVKRKVPRWKQRPEQINHKILETYFKMKKEDILVTQEALEKRCKHIHGDDFKFLSNFYQMHHISDQNNAKVFDFSNGEIKLWKHVKEFIEEVWNNK